MLVGCTGTSMIDSSDTPHILITLWCGVTGSDDVSTDSDGGGGGIEHCDGTGVNCDSVV